MKYIILFVIVFVIVFLLYLITVIENKRKLSKFSKTNQALLLINRYNLKIDKDNVKEFAVKIALANSLVVAVAITVIELVNNFLLKLLVGFLVMLPLILILYNMIGKSMQKEGKKHV